MSAIKLIFQLLLFLCAISNASADVYPISGHGSGYGLSAEFHRGQWHFAQISSGLKYTLCNGNGSSCTSATIEAQTIGSVSLKVVNDEPFIAYYDDTNDRLKIAFHTPSGWTTETVDSSGDAGNSVKLIQCGKRLCIGSYGASGVRISYGAPGTWTNVTVDSGTDTSPPISIASDVAGSKVYLAYRDPDAKRPRVASLTRENDGSFTTSLESIEHYTYEYGVDSVIAVDSTGNIRLSCLNSDGSASIWAMKKEVGETEWEFADGLTYIIGPLAIAIHPVTDIPYTFHVYQRFSGLFGNATYAQYSYPFEHEGFSSFNSTILPDVNGAFHFYAAPNLMFNSYNDPIAALQYSHGIYFGAPATTSYRVNQPTDADGDGIPNDKEDLYFTNASVADSDGDGLSDGKEVFASGSDPYVEDSDGDDISDSDDRDPLDASSNLIRDGSMNALDVGSWRAVNFPILKKKAISDVKVLFIQRDTGSAGVEQRDISTETSQDFYLRVKYRRLSGSVAFTLGWGSSSDIENNSFVDSSSSGWQTVSRTVTSPSSAGDLRFLATTTGEVEVDFVSLTESQGNDADGDGVIDTSDNCPADANANQANTDNDEYGDICDADDDADSVLDASDCAPSDPSKWRSSAFLDPDGDSIRTNGVMNSISCSGSTAPAGYTYAVTANDNCPAVSNSNQLNSDNDSTGNACENDDDNDGVEDGDDCDPLLSYLFAMVTRYPDLDSDDVADSLTGETTCGDPTVFFFQKTTNATLDNCPGVSNVNQADADSDSAGDVCDSVFNTPTPTPTPSATPSPTDTPDDTPGDSPGDDVIQLHSSFSAKYDSRKRKLSLQLGAKNAGTGATVDPTTFQCVFVLSGSSIVNGRTVGPMALGEVTASGRTTKVSLSGIPAIRGKASKPATTLTASLSCAGATSGNSGAVTLRSSGMLSRYLKPSRWLAKVSDELN